MMAKNGRLARKTAFYLSPFFKTSYLFKTGFFNGQILRPVLKIKDRD